ncbi:undecaprenyl-diphosphate phosphatase [bacterium CPR1]|nr:undecaprenyl-diphosphate phosphatase [bacterium CPR1]
MTPLQQAALLGLVQGLTEFLPVSSSAHLRLIPELAGWPYLGKGFDVALHGGTLVALVAYFRSDLGRLLSSLLPGRESDPAARRLLGRLALASLPVASFGFLLEHFLESHFQGALSVAFWLTLVGLAMALADRSPGRLEMRELSLVQALLVGLSQVLALFPGASRSGTTMAAGRQLGLTRVEAARFSFLLGFPVILGATIYKLLRWEGGDPLILLVGILAAASSGFLAIRLCLALLPRWGLLPFALYRLALALLLCLRSPGP